MDRQKKLLLFGAAWVSAGLLTWFFVVNAVMPKQEKTLRVVVAAHDVPTGSLLRKSDLKMVNYPEKDVPKGALFAAQSAENRVVMVPLNTNEPVLQGKLSDTTTVEGVASTIDRGYRAVSVQITEFSGVAGLIQPGSHVDVLFTRPGSMAEATTSMILQNVRVLSAGHTVLAGQVVDPKAPKSPTVTLVLTPEDAQKLELAKNQGKIGLSLRNPLDTTQNPNTVPLTTEVLDPMISARLARARRGRTTNVSRANLEDPNVWQELTGEKKPVAPRDARQAALEEEARRKKAESGKSKIVVDVYRGDKHVQESFR